MFAVINTPSFAFFIFLADNVYFLYYVTYMVFVSYGIFYIICPVLIAEYFGVKYFAVNYGSSVFVLGVFTILLQLVLGGLYDMNVTDVATHTCYGLHCYYVSSWILCVLSIVTLIASVCSVYQTL